MSNSHSTSRLNWRALVTNAVAAAKLLQWSRALLTLARTERDAAIPQTRARLGAVALPFAAYTPKVRTRLANLRAMEADTNA